MHSSTQSSYSDRAWSTHILSESKSSGSSCKSLHDSISDSYSSLQSDTHPAEALDARIAPSKIVQASPETRISRSPHFRETAKKSALRAITCQAKNDYPPNRRPSARLRRRHYCAWMPQRVIGSSAPAWSGWQRLHPRATSRRHAEALCRSGLHFSGLICVICHPAMLGKASAWHA
jgi:hypothetical protein